MRIIRLGYPTQTLHLFIFISQLVKLPVPQTGKFLSLSSEELPPAPPKTINRDDSSNGRVIESESVFSSFIIIEIKKYFPTRNAFRIPRLLYSKVWDNSALILFFLCFDYTEGIPAFAFNLNGVNAGGGDG